jgi:arylsulfatase A-like enzyme
MAAVFMFHLWFVFRMAARAGTVKNDLVSGIDIAPTLAGFAGILPSAGAMQGQDVFGPSYAPRTHVFAARDPMDISIRSDARRPHPSIQIHSQCHDAHVDRDRPQPAGLERDAPGAHRRLGKSGPNHSKNSSSPRL